MILNRSYNTLLTQSIQYAVGVLFVLSALIKIDDPLGLSYKIEEYFEVLRLPSFKSAAFFLAVAVNILEFSLGIAVILGAYMRFLRYVLLGTLLLFTFLTGFAFFSSKLKECGCFGACLPIRPKVSFIKDIVLLLMGGHLAWHYKSMRSLLSGKKRSYALFLSLIAAYLMQAYAYVFLPVWDCLPFKIHTHIPTAMEDYKKNIRDSVAMTFVYEKNGKEEYFSADNLPLHMDSFSFLRREDVVVPTKKSAATGIDDFMLLSLENNEDVSSFILDATRARLVFILDNVGWKRIEDQLKTPLSDSLKNGVDYYIVSSEQDRLKALFAKYHIPLKRGLIMDNVAIKTIARSPITSYTLSKGTIADKKGVLLYTYF